MGYKDHGKYFWPVNIPMDTSHFHGNIKIFHAITRPDWFLSVKMSDDLNFIQIEKFKNSGGVSDDKCLQYVHNVYHHKT